ncbi:MAG: GTPase Era [Pseudanabaenaceae cyanobacterium]
MTEHKSGFVAIVGRPNVGKSTLMNSLIGQKIAITSPVAQTTRNRLKGILTLPHAQIIFVDTPGIHKPHHLLGEVLVKNAVSAIKSVDLVLWLVDGSVDLGKGDQFIAELLIKSKQPVIVGINKIDLGQDGIVSYQEFSQQYNWETLCFSAITGAGLMALPTKIVEKLPCGPQYYPPDLVTDQPERFIMAELIREQILHLTREEVPHSVAVIIERVIEEPDITKVYACICVERMSQKGILIGKNGSMLKQIGTLAREQIQKLITGKVYLGLFVKVEPKWRSSRFQLSELGYTLED